MALPIPLFIHLHPGQKVLDEPLTLKNLDMILLGRAFGYNWHIRAVINAQAIPPRKPIALQYTPRPSGYVNQQSENKDENFLPIVL